MDRTDLHEAYGNGLRDSLKVPTDWKYVSTSTSTELYGQFVKSLGKEHIILVSSASRELGVEGIR